MGKKSTIPVLYKHPFRAQSRRKQICHEKKVKVKESEVAQLCPILCDPVGCSPPGSSVHRIFQARILEWVAISFPRGSSWSRDQTQVSHIAGRRFTLWAPREAHKFVRRNQKRPEKLTSELLPCWCGLCN